MKFLNSFETNLSKLREREKVIININETDYMEKDFETSEKSKRKYI